MEIPVEPDFGFPDGREKRFERDRGFRVRLALF